MRQIDTVVFDIGETLMNEDRSWSDWAHWVGVSPPVFFAALGATIARREDQRRTFEILVPGFDFEGQRAAKQASGRGWRLTADDLYPDAAGCLDALRSLGIGIGIAGNQPAGVEDVVAGLGLPVDFVVSSERLGVAKPAPAFFERVVLEAERPASSIAYVGDRLDNDVLPALAAGMTSIFIRRGPWGYVHATWPEVELAHARVDSLGEVVSAVEQIRGT